MSDRPTPETDSTIRNAQTADHPPTRLAATLTVKCGKLERERDEAREAFVIATDQMVIAQGKVRESNTERDDAREKAERYRREANKFMLQRDEARDAFVIATDQMGQAQCKLRESNTERNEAQNEILGWKNKWECAVEMAARAGVERDKAMEALMKIEDLFIDGTDIYADRENMGMIAIAALEETK